LKIENEILRKNLWLRHGCIFSNLSGWDGEMFCYACEIDFKRDFAQKIDKRLHELSKERDKKKVEEKEKNLAEDIMRRAGPILALGIMMTARPDLSEEEAKKRIEKIYGEKIFRGSE